MERAESFNSPSGFYRSRLMGKGKLHTMNSIVRSHIRTLNQNGDEILSDDKDVDSSYQVRKPSKDFQRFPPPPPLPESASSASPTFLNRGRDSADTPRTEAARQEQVATEETEYSRARSPPVFPHTSFEAYEATLTPGTANGNHDQLGNKHEPTA
ncbi:hypothetical protein EJ08DRAFT_662322 [Tothia fuscella]|uniref:Uncharacterized protein n=1 Tax=Tothia fuscella TaxID=1048955 RepID=A0A9P4NMW4_9PEZI|nr:hypothetical protein EJ08DRAFT_662322 [Tothia fuscella]